jgi:penicillin-binding protein 1C
MFNVFNEIGSGYESAWFDVPEGIETRRLCAVSGKLPGDFCPATIEAQCIRGRSDIQRCDIHQTILVDRETGFRLCRYCSAGRPHDEVTIVEWPANVATWLGGQADLIPPHYPDCQGMLMATAPVITSPLDEAVYVIQPGIPESYQKILLQASLASSADRAHWFIDHQWYASCGMGEKVFYAPAVGRHRLMCVDDQGRSESVTIEVR